VTGFTRGQFYVIFILLFLMTGIFFLRSRFLKTDTGGKTGARPKWVYEVRGDVRYPGFYTYTEKQRLDRLINACEATVDGIESIEFGKPLKSGTRVTVREQVTIAEMSANARLNFFLPVDVNSASAADLMLVPGIGQKTAAAIMRYRDQNGRIDGMAELLHVRGIGEKTLKRITSCLSATVE